MHKVNSIPKARSALNEERAKMERELVWNIKTVQPRAKVQQRAAREKRKIHFGIIMELCHEKHAQLKRPMAVLCFAGTMPPTRRTSMPFLHNRERTPLIWQAPNSWIASQDSREMQEQTATQSGPTTKCVWTILSRTRSRGGRLLAM